MFVCNGRWSRRSEQTEQLSSRWGTQARIEMLDHARGSMNIKRSRSSSGVAVKSNGSEVKMSTKLRAEAIRSLHIIGSGPQKAWPWTLVQRGARRTSDCAQLLVYLHRVVLSIPQFVATLDSLTRSRVVRSG